jgi:hypothetical protein
MVAFFSQIDAIGTNVRQSVVGDGLTVFLSALERPLHFYKLCHNQNFSNMTPKNKI